MIFFLEILMSKYYRIKIFNSKYLFIATWWKCSLEKIMCPLQASRVLGTTIQNFSYNKLYNQCVFFFVVCFLLGGCTLESNSLQMEVLKENLNISCYFSKNEKLQSDRPIHQQRLMFVFYCTTNFINMTEVLKVVFLRVHNAHVILFF